MIKKILFSIFLFFQINISFAENITANYLKESESQDFILNKNKENIDYEIFFFFSYHCPSCYKFQIYEEELEKYFKKEDNVKYYKIPVQFFKGWEKGAEMHYLTKNIIPEKNLSSDLYKFINTQEYNIKNITNFLNNNSKKEITTEEVEQFLNSKKIKFQMENSIKFETELNVDATPTIIVINKNKERFKIKPSINQDYKNMVISAIYLTLK